MGNERLRRISNDSGLFTNGLTEQLQAVHDAVHLRYPSVDRIALATYSAQTDTLNTFVSSNSDGELLNHYKATLSEVPSLKKLVESRQSRVIDDIPSTFTSPSAHSDWLKTHQYRASLTVPIFRGENLAAILFFDSKNIGAFDAETTAFLEIFANLISKLYLLQLQVANNLVGSVHIASSLAQIRDLETGRHLERMAAYSRLMGEKLAVSHNLSDELIEYIYLFAPLHDIGKVGIPDKILLKPGKLDADEYTMMKRHVEIGETIAVQMGQDLCNGNPLAFHVMQNIIAGHHERGDGSGYPRGLKMSQIPIEARIVAVADVYDALSNARPYKKAWTEEEIKQEFTKELALGKLDEACVDALMNANTERQAIQQRFGELNT